MSDCKDCCKGWWVLTILFFVASIVLSILYLVKGKCPVCTANTCSYDETNCASFITPITAESCAGFVNTDSCSKVIPYNMEKLISPGLYYTSNSSVAKNYVWKSGVVNSLQISDMNSLVDSTLTDNYYVYMWGLFKAPITGTYTFSAMVDDKVVMDVNNVTVLDVGYTASKYVFGTNTVSLTAGVYYPIVVRFFEYSGAAVMNIKYTVNATEYTMDADLYHSSSIESYTSRQNSNYTLFIALVLAFFMYNVMKK